jgi:hypothetical protein
MYLPCTCGLFEMDAALFGCEKNPKGVAALNGEAVTNALKLFRICSSCFDFFTIIMIIND